jgi:uncharacterized coiled-coil protein SlyX
MCAGDLGQKYKDTETENIIANLKRQLAEKDQIIARLEKLLQEQQNRFRSV